MGMHCWGVSKQGVKYDQTILVLSRVTERASIYAGAIMKYILNQLDAQWLLTTSFDSFEVWSDVAPQFKSRRTLCEVAYMSLDRYQWRRATYQYGCEEHFKSVVDSTFGILDGIRGTLEKTTCEVEEVVEAYQEYFIENEDLLNISIPLVVSFMPQIKMNSITLSSQAPVSHQSYQTATVGRLLATIAPRERTGATGANRCWESA